MSFYPPLTHWLKRFVHIELCFFGGGGGWSLSKFSACDSPCFQGEELAVYYQQRGNRLGISGGGLLERSLRRGGALIVLEEKQGPIREVMACKGGVGGLGLASLGPGGGKRGNGQLRAGACAPDVDSVCATERCTARWARVGSGLAPPRACTGLKLTGDHPCYAGATAVWGLLLQWLAPPGVRSSWASAGRGIPSPRARASARDPAAAVTVAAPRLPPAPLRIEPTACGSGELPGARAPLHAGDPLRAGRWEGLTSFVATRGGAQHLRPLGSRDSAGPWPVADSWATWEGEWSQWSRLGFPDSQRHWGPDPQGRRAGPRRRHIGSRVYRSTGWLGPVLWLSRGCLPAESVVEDDSSLFPPSLPLLTCVRLKEPRQL